MIERLFGLEAQGTTVSREIIAGVTTFLAMAYIIVVNPLILSEAGMDSGAVFVATCLAAAIGTAIMGVLANYPIALAPGMGLNAFFTYGVVLGLGIPWEVALGAVFFSGVIFIALTLLPIREWIINAIPLELKQAITAGLGLFLIIIGLSSVGMIADHPVTLVTLGNLAEPTLWLAAFGFLIIGVLEALKVPGGIILGIGATTLAGVILGISPVPGVVAPPPSIAPTLFALDLQQAFNLALVSVVISFLFVDLFDTAGTLVGVAQRAGLLDENGKLPRLRLALFADSTATLIGSLLGTSSTTSYVESAAGVRAGGRTGLTALTVALLFLLALFFAPLAGAVQSYATGPALVFVGCVMVRGLTEVDWDDVTSFVPAVVTAVAMPLTYSIATGIGLGFITYAVLKLLTGRIAQATPGVLILALLFLVKFALIDAA